MFRYQNYDATSYIGTCRPAKALIFLRNRLFETPCTLLAPSFPGEALRDLFKIIPRTQDVEL